MLSKRSFSDQATYERFVAEEEERAGGEAARLAADRAIDDDNAEDERRADSELSKNASFDWMGLRNLDDHPLVTTASKRLEDAKRRVADAEAAMEQAHAAIRTAEIAAAHGRRDPKGLDRAQTSLRDAETEVRIARTSVDLAAEQVEATRRACRFAGAAYLKSEHRKAVRALDAALDEAAKHSRRAAALEDKSRLFAPPMTGRRARGPRAIRPVAWRKEFNPGGYLDYWRKFARSVLKG